MTITRLPHDYDITITFPSLPVSKHESALGLLLIEGGGGTAYDESSAGVAPQALLENTC